VALPFRQQVEEEWARAFETAANGSAMHGLAANGLASVLAFGPRNSGPNVLVRRPGMKVRLLTVEKRGEEGEEEEEREAFVPGSVEGERLRERVWRALENSVVTGFQMATASGTLYTPIGHLYIYILYVYEEKGGQGERRAWILASSPIQIAFVEA
jgi:hypothetical protein